MLFSQKFVLIQNSFVAIHNKMFSVGAKILVESGNLTHISGLDMHWYWRTRQSKKISNDQELIQSDPISRPQNQKGK